MHKWLYYYILDNETLSLIIQQRQIMEEFDNRILVGIGSCWGYLENLSRDELNKIVCNRYISDVELDQEAAVIIHRRLLISKSLYYQSIIDDEQSKFADKMKKLINIKKDCYDMIKKILK